MLSLKSPARFYGTIRQQHACIFAISVLIPHALVFLALLPLTFEWKLVLFSAAKATWLPCHLIALVAVMQRTDSIWRVCFSGLGAWFISGPAVVPSLAFCYTQIFSDFSEPTGLPLAALYLTKFFVSTFFAFIVIQVIIVIRRYVKFGGN